MSLLHATEETLRLTKEALSDNALAKNVTFSTGLSAYDLQAPAKNLYPVVTPLRNALPRVAAPPPRRRRPLAHHHLDHRLRLRRDGLGAGRPALGQHVATRRTPQVAPYVTLGEEDTVTFEAEAAAQGFEDLNSTATLRLSAEDDAQGGDGAPRRQHLACARHAGGADALRLRHRRDAARRDLFGDRRRAHLRRLPQLARSPAASPPPRRSPATTATPTRSTAAPRCAAPTPRRR